MVSHKSWVGDGHLVPKYAWRLRSKKTVFVSNHAVVTHKSWVGDGHVFSFLGTSLWSVSSCEGRHKMIPGFGFYSDEPQV